MSEKIEILTKSELLQRIRDKHRLDIEKWLEKNKKK
jgi:hypothetical protein